MNPGSKERTRILKSRSTFSKVVPPTTFRSQWKPRIDKSYDFLALIEINVRSSECLPTDASSNRLHAMQAYDRKTEASAPSVTRH